MSVAFHKRRHASALAALQADVPLVMPATSSVGVGDVAGVAVEKVVEIVSAQVQPRPSQQQHNQRRDERRR